MSEDRLLKRLASRLGYHFINPDLMVLALTHRSFSGKNNERLEFLGDAILNFVIGEALFHDFPEAKEGPLSRLRATLVREETLAVIARQFELGDFIRLGSGELKSGGFRRDSILADTVEALIGAMYLDSGIEATKARILAWYADEFKQLTLIDTHKDPKTVLQEWLQSKGYELPSYLVVDTKGEPHERTFFVECVVNMPKITTSAQGNSRRAAEREAAKKAWQQISGELKNGK